MSDTSKSLAGKSVSLLTGDDAKEGAALRKSFREAQQAGRRIMSFGLRVWEIKTLKLKHGQWGPWLINNAPELCKVDKSGKLLPKESSSVHSYCQMTKDVLEDMGYTVEKYFKQISNSQLLGICHGGKFLLTPPSKLPKEAAELQKQICDRVDNKTAKQIRLAFSQVEEEEETGDLKTKRGRRKGEGGASAEQRAAAKEREERERIEDCEAECLEAARIITEQSDAKHAGLISDAAFKKFADALELGNTFCKRLQTERRGK